MRALVTLLLAAALATAPPVRAGQSCEEKPLTAERLARGLALAEQTYAALEASGDRVVVLARAGRDLTRHGLRYSHLGFAYREDDDSGAHRWRVLHKLNACGSGRGLLYRQGLGEFFLDDLWRFEAAWARPSPEVQARLLALITDPRRLAVMNEARYNLVAYPWSTRYQQSNQWLAETVAAALDPGVASRRDAQQWLRRHHYRPTLLRLGALERLGARVGTANVAFDDHPDGPRYAGRIETVGADSVFDWLAASGLAATPRRLALP